MNSERRSEFIIFISVNVDNLSTKV